MVSEDAAEMGAVVGGSEAAMRLREICCDSCPFNPACEEQNEFLRDIGPADNERAGE